MTIPLFSDGAGSIWSLLRVLLTYCETCFYGAPERTCRKKIKLLRAHVIVLFFSTCPLRGAVCFNVFHCEIRVLTTVQTTTTLRRQKTVLQGADRRRGRLFPWRCRYGPTRRPTTTPLIGTGRTRRARKTRRTGMRQGLHAWLSSTELAWCLKSTSKRSPAD